MIMSSCQPLRTFIDILLSEDYCKKAMLRCYYMINNILQSFYSVLTSFHCDGKELAKLILFIARVICKFMQMYFKKYY